MTPQPQDDLLKLDRQLCFALYAATRSMMNSYRQPLTALGITFPQYLVLLVLWEKGESTVKELGQALWLDSGTLSPLLKRLEKVGLIRKKRNKDDERIVEIHLTPQGDELRQQAMGVASDFTCHTGLERSEFVLLRDQLRQLALTLTDESETRPPLCEPDSSSN